MKNFGLFILVMIYGLSCSPSKKISAPSIDPYTKIIQGGEFTPGFFPLWWKEDKGKLYMEVNEFDKEFLYINYLAHGLGSNDIGLDRGQIGNSRLVKFMKAGDKILLVQPNLKYRGSSANQEEVKSIQEAFAPAVIGGFPIVAKKNGIHLIDVTSFLLRDAHGVVNLSLIHI